MAAVDEHRQLHGARAAEFGERVEGGADRASGEQHVVDEDHGAAGDAALGLDRLAERADAAQPQVVAVAA